MRHWQTGAARGISVAATARHSVFLAGSSRKGRVSGRRRRTRRSLSAERTRRTRRRRRRSCVRVSLLCSLSLSHLFLFPALYRFLLRFNGSLHQHRAALVCSALLCPALSLFLSTLLGVCLHSFSLSSPSLCGPSFSLSLSIPSPFSLVWTVLSPSLSLSFGSGSSWGSKNGDGRRALVTADTDNAGSRAPLLHVHP